MRCPRSQHPKLWSSRFLVARLLSLAVPLALSACGSDDSPLGPSDPPTVPGGETLAPSEQTTPDFTLTTASQRILFTSNRTGVGYDLFKVDPLGSNLSHVTNFTNYETDPAWSRDNKRIAMVRPRKDVNNVEHSDIYLMNADGTNKRWARSQASGFDMRYPAWSPDGTQLVLSVFFGGKPYLATIEVATGNIAFVLFAGKIIQGNYPSYEPGKGRILYVDGTGKSIWLLGIGAGASDYLMVSSETTMSNPRFSPDASKIAFAKTVGSNVDVYVKSIYSATATRLTTDPAYDGGPTWSPDGSRIAFQSTRTGNSQIWVMNSATGGSLTRITKTNWDEKSPDWSH